MHSEEILMKKEFTKEEYIPWDGHNVRNAAPKNRGEMMANFVRGRGDMMGVAGSLNDNGSITTDVKSYWPNDYGLYCMAGNVNEWVQDVYRPLTSEDMDGFNPFRGNVFTDLKRDVNGAWWQKINLDASMWTLLRILMLQTDIIIRKAITEITGMETFSLLFRKAPTGHTEDNKRGSQRMYAQDDSKQRVISLLLSMIMPAFIKVDHGKTEHTGSIPQQEDSLIRRVHVMILDSGVP